jgi:purine-cytosine permease-like protein
VDYEDLVMNFLNKFHLTIAFDIDWSAIVNDYEEFINMQTNKYKLPSPTFFGGIIGELE